jgi:hypothetical protein
MRTFKLLLTVSMILCFAPAAFGCVCMGTTVEKSFTDKAAIFTGTFLRSEYRKGIRSDYLEMDFEYTGKRIDYEVMVNVFAADRWWKGSWTREVVLITEQTRMADGSEGIPDCQLSFTVGRKYLVYAYGEDDHLATSECSLTKRISRASKDIITLNKLTRPVAAKQNAKREQ